MQSGCNRSLRETGCHLEGAGAREPCAVEYICRADHGRSVRCVPEGYIKLQPSSRDPEGCIRIFWSARRKNRCCTCGILLMRHYHYFATMAAEEKRYFRMLNIHEIVASPSAKTTSA